MSAKLQQVHVRVNDAATGKPTPCRVRFTDAEGNYYAPNGRLAKFATGFSESVGGNVRIGTKTHAYIDGTCEIGLPPGRLHVEISKGPEYQPVCSAVELTVGKLSLRFALRRWIDLRVGGWYSGDTRALFLAPHAALLEGQAEDLAVVNLLATETTEYGGEDGEPLKAYPNLLAFSGQQFALSVPGHGVAVNTLNRHPVLGTLALLHCHRVVYPLTFGDLDGRTNWTLADWCDQCHRKGGLVVWAEVAQQCSENGGGEALADLVLGKIDAIELHRNARCYEDEPAYWIRLYNAGLRATLVGASGKVCNGHVLGSVRTFAHLQPGESLTFKNWIEAVRAGRTFVTQGPILTLRVDGAEPSATVLNVQAGQSLQIHAEAQSWLPFSRLAVWWNGESLETVNSGDGPPYRAAIDIVRKFDTSGWLAACCYGQTPPIDVVSDQDIIAVTSPIYLGCAGPQSRATAGAIRGLIGDLDRRIGWVQDLADCDSDQDRQRLSDVFLQAKRVLSEKLAH